MQFYALLRQLLHHCTILVNTGDIRRFSTCSTTVLLSSPLGKFLTLTVTQLCQRVDLDAIYPKNSVEEMNQDYSKLWFDKDQNGKVLGPERYKYAPIVLQLVARRYEEEKVLGMLRTVVEARRNGGLESY